MPATNETPQIRINDWVKNAWIDYTAGREGWDDDARRPVSVALISRPGESKSNQVERVLPNVVESRLLSDCATNEVPAELLQHSALHWAERGLVAVISEPTNTRDAPDLRGFMFPKKDGTSAYTVPDLVVLERKCYAAGAKVVVLLLDEFLGTDHLTMKAMTDIFLNGRFGSFGFRSTTWVVGASNRPQDGAGVNRALTILTNRMNILNVYLHVDDWVAYARQHLDIPELLFAYAKAFPGEITVDVPPREGPFPSMRSLTFAGEWMSAYKRAIGDEDPMTLPTDSYARAKVAGFVGDGLTTLIMSFSKVAMEVPNIKEIERDPLGAKVPPLSRMDAAYVAAQQVIYYAEPKNVEALMAYTERLPKDLQTSVVKELMFKGRGVLQNSEALNAWMAENSDLVRSTLG